MQFGMPTLIENRTLEENAALCQSLGLRFLELNMNFPEYQIEALERTDALLRIGERFGVYYTIHLDENLNVADFNPLAADAYRETVHRAIGAAKRLLSLRDRCGDSERPLVLNMHMHHGVHVTLPERKVQLYDRDFEPSINAFASLRSLCEAWIGDGDVRLAVENTDGFRDYEKKAIELLLESPVFGLTWDVGHSRSARERDVPFLLAHRDHLLHFHIHDGTETPPRSHLALGDGEIDLRERLVLAESRNARCVLETKTIEALKASVDWLRREGFLT